MDINMEKTAQQRMNTKDICKELRQQVKAKFPECTFSIVMESWRAIHIDLMKAPFNPFGEETDGHHLQLSHSRIKEDKRLSESAKLILHTVYQMTWPYNYDNSDAMTDYFDVNFYLRMSIGKWDRAFEQTK